MGGEVLRALVGLHLDDPAHDASLRTFVDEQRSQQVGRHLGGGPVEPGTVGDAPQLDGGLAGRDGGHRGSSSLAISLGTNGLARKPKVGISVERKNSTSTEPSMAR